MKRVILSSLMAAAFVFCLSGLASADGGWYNGDAGIKSTVKLVYVDAFGKQISKSFTITSNGDGWLSLIGPDSSNNFLVALRNYQDGLNWVYTDTIGSGVTKGTSIQIYSSWDAGAEVNEPTSLSLQNDYYLMPPEWVNASSTNTKVTFSAATGVGSIKTVTTISGLTWVGFSIYPANYTVTTSVKGVASTWGFTSLWRPFDWN